MTTVLVVEDDTDNRQLLLDTLGRAGFATRPAPDGRHLTELAQAVDAVILDVSLPGRSGLDLCRSLRADPDTAALPVLLVSGHATDAQVRAGLAAGADSYVAKPYSPAELMTELRRLLDRSAVGLPAAAGAVGLRATYRSGARLLVSARGASRTARSA